jgi:hypothetical protein
MPNPVPHEYSDDCPDCQPAMLDLQTGRPLAADDPIMVAINKAWKEQTTLDERKAYSRVLFHQSKDPEDRRIYSKVVGIMTQAAQEVKK